MAAPRQAPTVTVVNGNGGLQGTGRDIRTLASLSTPSARKAEASRLKDAAEVIAVAARARAATFSRRIPAATGVGGGLSAKGVYIRTSGRKARNAAPFEFGERHPLFGNYKHMYNTPHRPYMEEAAEAALDAAAEAYAEVIDDWAHELGFK